MSGPPGGAKGVLLDTESLNADNPLLIEIGIDVIHERVRCLTGWLLHELLALRPRDPELLARLAQAQLVADRNEDAARRAWTNW